MTTVEVRRDGDWEEIDFGENWRIVNGVHDATVAPSATIPTQAREDITAGQDIRITEDGSTLFEGITESGGRKRTGGQVQLNCEHPAAALFEETVSFTESGSPTDEDVLLAALSDADSGGDFTLDYSGSATTLDSEYDADDRPVKQVFRDMMDRTSRTWWIDPAGTTINVQPRGDRGTWESLDAQDDGVEVRSFDSGSVDTVRNYVTVNATGGTRETATASDSDSIDDYGRRAKSFNIGYADTEAEAKAVAEALRIPEPLAQGEILVPNTDSVGDITQPLPNYYVDLTDDERAIDADDLLVEKQTLEQGRVTLKVGEGSGVSIANNNRESKSRIDTTEPGSVMDSDRIADGSVLEQKLADLAVTLDKVSPDAIDETKIQDDSIETPKLAAGAVIASKIASDTITANEIDVLDLATGELTIGTDADEQIVFDTTDVNNTPVTRMEPTADGLSVIGADGNRFTAVWAGELWGESVNLDGNAVANLTEGPGNFSGEPVFVPDDAGTGSIGAISDSIIQQWGEVRADNIVEQTPEELDGVDLSKLRGHSWRKPPEYVAQKKVSTESGAEYRRQNPSKKGVGLGHMA
ncbi:MAG: hypothetical protein ACOCUA_03035, partial [archaeon]